VGEFYRNGDNFQEAEAGAAGLKLLTDLNADVIAIEPTGVHYTKLWINRLAVTGVRIALIGHTQLRSYRKNLGLPDKDDPADALALALYAAEHLDKPRRFVSIRDDKTAEMRATVLHLGHLARLQSPIINKLKQSLAYAFPERAQTNAAAPLFWRWLAGEGRSIRYDQELAESIGGGITAEMRGTAKMLVMCQTEERRVAAGMSIQLNDPAYRPYREVMSRYGMGERAQAVLISQIYPIENFLSDDGKPIVEVSKGKRSGKNTAKHLSRRRVSKMFGTAPTREQSGKSPTATKKAGSEACRQALWLWHFSRIESSRSRLKTELGDKLYNRFADLKSKNPIKLARSKAIGKVANDLFYDLVESVNSDKVILE
jgi:transposase